VAVAGAGQRRSLARALAWIEAVAARHPVRVRRATRGAIALVHLRPGRRLLGRRDERAVAEASAPYRAFHWFVLQPE